MNRRELLTAAAATGGALSLGVMSGRAESAPVDSSVEDVAYPSPRYDLDYTSNDGIHFALRPYLTNTTGMHCLTAILPQADHHLYMRVWAQEAWQAEDELEAFINATYAAISSYDINEPFTDDMIEEGPKLLTEYYFSYLNEMP